MAELLLICQDLHMSLSLDENISRRNIFLSFIQPFYTVFNRNALYRGDGEDQELEKLYPFNYIMTGMSHRDKIVGCNAFIEANVVKFSGGRHDPHDFVIYLWIKTEDDLLGRISLPLLDEVTRIYEQSLPLYSFTGNTKTDTGNLLFPVHKTDTYRQGEPMGEYVMSFSVFNDRRNSKF